MSNTDPFREQLEAYALGALDREERAAMEAHLATGCAECTKGLEESRWLVSQLAYLAPEAKPSDTLRGRLLQTVREEAEDQKSGASPSHAKGGIPAWMWGAVAAAVLFALYNFWNTEKERSIIVDLQKQISEQVQRQQQEQQELVRAHREAVILTDPRSVKIAMSAGQKDLPTLQATWHAALGIVVTGQKLPVPSSTRTLQLWLIPKVAGAKPIPSLTLRPDADGKFDLLVAQPPEAMEATKALAITEEPEGGSAAPTTTPMWIGAVGGK